MLIAEGPAAVALDVPVTVTTNSVDLTWDESLEGDFSVYRIYRSTASGFDWRTTTLVTEIGDSSTLSHTDITVTPSASLRVFDGLGIPQITTPGVNVTSRGFTRILDGDHGSFISPAANLAATVEMQTEVAVFLGGNPLAQIPPNGQVILIANPDIVETD